MDNLLSILTFVRIADAGNLSAAARTMGRSLPAVSRSLVQLEEQLGVRLLHRTTRTTRLTEAGQHYLERCRRILAELDEANTSVSELGSSLAGPISMTAPILFGQKHVAPIVMDFLAEHPGVTLHLNLTDHFVSIVESGVDLAVRIGELPDSNLVARRIGAVRRVVCASPRYLAQQGIPKHPKELATHNCLQFSSLSPTPYWDFHIDGKLQPFRVRGSFSSNSAAPIINASRNGLGIIVVLSYQVQEYIENGELRVILQPFEPQPVPIQAVYSSVRFLPSRIRTLIDLLTDRLGSKDWVNLTVPSQNRSKSKIISGRTIRRRTPK